MVFNAILVQLGYHVFANPLAMNSAKIFDWSKPPPVRSRNRIQCVRYKNFDSYPKAMAFTRWTLLPNTMNENKGKWQPVVICPSAITVKARFVYYKKRYVHCNNLNFMPATKNAIEKNTSCNSFGSLGSGIITSGQSLGFPQFLAVLHAREARASTAP